MKAQREATMEAVRALMNLEDYRVLGFVNHLLEDPPSTNRVRQVLAFLSEVTLFIPGEQFSEAMTQDATEGLGWILRSCHEALATLEDIGSAERQKDRIKEVTS